MFETNLFGAAAVIQAALPAMREAGGGSLVFVSSIGARISNPLLGMYHASKWGMSAMAEALAVECRPFGIRVTTLEPGMVNTDFPRATRPTGRAPAGEGPYQPLLTSLREGFAAWREGYPTRRRTSRRRSWRRRAPGTARSGCRWATTRAPLRPARGRVRRPGVAAAPAGFLKLEARDRAG